MSAALEYILEQIRGVWRFRLIMVLVAWPVCILGWLYVLATPDTYQASARVFVDTRTRLSQVTQGIAVESNIGSQVDRVREALLGGPQLEKVVAATIPGFANFSTQQHDAMLAQFKDRLSIVDGRAKASLPPGTYLISYQDRNRQTSLKVVDQLVKAFVTNALGNNREGSEQARRFLSDQIAEYEQKLVAAENRLAEFKKKNVGLMPGAEGDYFTRLQNGMDTLQKDRESLTVAIRRREELHRQLTGEQPLLGGNGNASAGTTTLVAAGAGLAGDTTARIRETQARLDDLLLRFTEKHPDVTALRETLTELKARQAAEIEAAKHGDPSAIAASGLSANPVYQSTQLQLNQADVDIAALRSQVAEREAKIADLRKLVNTAPEVEAEFKRLNRDYDVTRGEYQTLVERLGRTRLSDDADATGIVRFEVIDPPRASYMPVAPDRPRLIIMVLLMGLGAGLGVAYLMHQLRPVFNSSRQLTEITRLPVLGVVSMTWIDRHQLAARRTAWIYGCVVGVLLVAAGLVVGVSQPAAKMVHKLIS